MTNDASSSPSLSPSLSLQLIEPLLVLEEHKSARNHSKRRFTVVFFVGVVFSLWFSLLLLYFYNGHEKRTLTYRDRTQPMQPTLFSVVDSETLDYARASEHYTDWRHTLKKPFLTTKLPVVLKLSKTNIFSLRESLVVSWETIKEQVQDTDAIALFCDDHLLETATIAQARATSYRHNGGTSPNHWYIPHFPLSRVSTCHFILFRQSIPMAFSPPLNIHLMDFPTNLHLALGDDVTKMVIQFTTGMSGIPVAMYNGTISKGLSTTYQAFDMCGPPANKTGPGQFVSPGFLHTVEMVNLLPDTTYSYQVGLQDRADRSDIYEFTSPPNVGDDSKPYTYVVYGDQGCPSDGWAKGGNYTAAMVHRELSKGAKAVHHFGDLSYARGAAHIWDEWMTMIQPFSTKIPLMIAVGNHEYDHSYGGGCGKDPSGVFTSHGFMPTWGNFGDDSGGECGVPTSKRFQMPNSGNGVFWYSYNSALVHTIVLSSEHDLSEHSRQHSWLKADLNSIDRSLTPWVVVELHRPLYVNEMFWNQNAVGIGMRREFEHVLRGSVDLVLSGHYHAYFRSCFGLFQSQCNNGGPTHIMVGSAGAPLDDVGVYSNHWSVKNIQGVYGYGRITIANKTALQFEFVQAGPQDDQKSGEVLDEVWISK